MAGEGRGLALLLVGGARWPVLATLLAKQNKLMWIFGPGPQTRTAVSEACCCPAVPV